jgi:hypothetical protein
MERMAILTILVGSAMLLKVGSRVRASREQYLRMDNSHRMGAPIISMAPIMLLMAGNKARLSRTYH